MCTSAGTAIMAPTQNILVCRGAKRAGLVATCGNGIACSGSHNDGVSMVAFANVLSVQEMIRNTAVRHHTAHVIVAENTEFVAVTILIVMGYRLAQYPHGDRKKDDAPHRTN